MSSADLEAKLKAIIAEQLNVDEELLKPEARFAEDLKADSLDLVELIMALEEKFDVEIPDDEAEQIRTVGDAVEYIDKRRGAASVPAGEPEGTAET